MSVSDDGSEERYSIEKDRSQGSTNVSVGEMHAMCGVEEGDV